jgi:mannose-6-phosphate isomerase-like protein (cupin superfamily)
MGSVAMQKVNLAEKFAAFSEHWRPKVVGGLNGQEVKVVKFRGEFVWHTHEAEDELFLVWRGRFRVEFRDRAVELGPGEFLMDGKDSS